MPESVRKITQVKRTRVNGLFLQQYHGKPVSMLGTVVRSDGGSSFQLKGSDSTSIVNIRMKQPLLETLSGLVEVFGIGQGKNLIVADNLITFPEALSSSFDMQVYNEAITLVHAMESCPWKPKP